MHNAYAPADGLATKIMRRITPLRNRREIRYSLDRPIVSFTFDDCPKSALTHGLVPMEQQGWRGTVYVASGLFGTTNHHGLHLTAEDVQRASQQGHEIGGHSYSHIDGNQTSLPDFLADIDKNQATLTALGLPACRTFAYPFGEVTPALKHALSARFDGLRGIAPRAMVGRADLNQICSTPVFNGYDFDRAMTQISQLSTRPAWLTLFMHDITDTPSDWGCTPAQMQAVITAVAKSGARVLPVADAIDYLKGQSHD